MLHAEIKLHSEDVYEVTLQDPAPRSGRPLNLIFACSSGGLGLLAKAAIKAIETPNEPVKMVEPPL